MVLFCIKITSLRLSKVLINYSKTSIFYNLFLRKINKIAVTKLNIYKTNFMLKILFQYSKHNFYKYLRTHEDVHCSVFPIHVLKLKTLCHRISLNALNLFYNTTFFYNFSYHVRRQRRSIHCNSRRQIFRSRPIRTTLSRRCTQLPTNFTRS